MKKLIVLLMMVGLMVTAAQAGFVENFDSYTAGSLPTTDWELERTVTGTTQQGVAAGGYSGKGIGTWIADAQYRAAGVGAYQLTARMRDTTDAYDSMVVGFCAGNADDAATDWLRNSVFMQTGNSYIQMRHWDGNGDHVQSLITATNLTDDWYDVRMTVTGMSVFGEYKLSSASTWISIGTINAATGFAANYVSLDADRANVTAIDDIVVVPEPATMAILGLGGLLLRRRKA